MVHVAFVSSPHAHAKIAVRSMFPTRCVAAAGCAAGLYRPADLAPHCEPWVAVLAHLKGMKSAPQLPLPLHPTTWAGEAVAAVVADSRAVAEDAVALRISDRLADAPAGRRHGDGARTRQRPSSIPSSATTWSSKRTNESGDITQAFKAAHKIVEATFQTGRHTGRDAPASPILAEYNKGDGHAHRPPRDAGAAHDAGGARQASPAAAQRRARHLPGHRRQLRHQGARLPRRGRRRRNCQDHGPAHQIRGRPAGELRLRHPCARPPREGSAWPSMRRNASPPSTSTT